MRYEDASHTDAFQGSGPIANDDLEVLAAGLKSAATGNLITGEGTQSGSAGADSASGGHITAIAGKGGEDTSFAGGKLSVDGEYGRLSVDGEGNYVYQANKGVENVRDRFTYTLADNQGASDSASLIVEIGKTPVVIKANAQQIVPGPDGVVTLPPGVELSDVHVVGRNLVIDMPDGTQLIIIDGAVFVPQLVLGGVEIPATNVAALLVGQEIQPAAGEIPPSSGGNFAVPPPPLDPGVPLGDLIPPTEYVYQPPEPQPTFDVLNTEPEAGAASAILDDDAQAGGIAGGVGDDPGSNFASGNLPGSDGDGSLEWALLASGTLPSGFSFSPQGNGDLWVMQGATHVLTITVNPANGDYTVTQVAAIDHPAGGDENNLIFIVNYSVTDDDGDSAVGTLTINVDDDTPTIDTTVASDANVLLTTQDAQTDGDPTDTDTDSTSANFGGIFGVSSAFGADGAGSTSTSYALSTTGGASGLTQHGVAINLYLIGGVVVGSTAASAGAVNASNTVFDISVNASGVVTVNQYSQIDHTNTDPSPTGPGYEDHLISLADGSVTLTRTDSITDGDGDTATDSASVGIGANIRFADDGPSIDPTLNEVGAAIVDESEPVDTATIPLVGGFTAGDDPHLAGGLAIGKGSTSGPVIDANALFGADGPATGGGIGYDLVVLNAVSGLTTTEGTAINLVELSNGVVVGVVDGTTTVAFAIQIDSATGVVTVEQYLSLFHPDSPNNFDEPVFLDEGSLGVTVTASDFDGDSVTSGAVDITSLIRFEDDGPSINPALNANAAMTVDESLPSNTPGINTGAIVKGDDPDLSGGIALGQANSGSAIVNANAVFGADGPAVSGSISYALSILNVSSGFTLTDGTPINLQMVGGVIVGVVSGGTFNGQAAFAIAINSSTGVVSVEQYLSLDHPLNPNPNDPLSFGSNIIGVTVTATDGDGDPVTSGAVDIGGQLIFLDDGPVANNDVDSIVGGLGPATGNVLTGVEVAVAEDANGTDGVADAPGADGGRITFIDHSNPAPGSVVPDGGSVSIAGDYGVLTIYSNGDYSYLRNDGTPGGVSDVFTYTLTDGDGDPTTATLTISIDDNFPTLPDPALVRLDDDVIPAAGGNVDGPSDDDPDTVGQNVVNGNLVGSGGDGDLDYFFTGLNTLPSGFSVNAAGLPGSIQILQGATVVMTITLNNETGAFTVTQNNPILHPVDNGGPDDNIENNLLFSIGVQVQDADGDTEPATITINVDDDTPTIDVTKGSDAAVILTTDDADTIGVATDTAVTTANFGGVFGLTQSAGADGTAAAATLSFALDVTGYTGGPAGVNSGLESHDADIFLYEIGGKVVGSTSATLAGVNAGNTVFDVGVSGTGVVTLTQYSQIDHDTADPTPTGTPFADHIVSLTDSLVTLTASSSLTDNDGDTVTDSETVNIGANLHFTDDGPDANTSGTAVGTVTLDETRPEGSDTPGGTAPTGDASATIDFSVNFVTGGSVDYGADGPGSVTYALQLTGSNVNSGLYALDGTDTETVIDGYGQGAQIVLNQVGNTITGSVGATNYFTITINPATGVVTFTQLNNIWHPTAGGASFDESATLNTLTANLIQVIQTVTDFDGDTDTASINIGQGVFQIQDDGPRFGPDIDATLNILNDATPSNTGDLDIVIGTDSPNGSVAGPPAQNPDDLSVSNFTVLVNGDPVTETLTLGTETATTANYTFSFTYDTGDGTTDTANGTLVFHKDTGTYDVTLDNPIQGFSVQSVQTGQTPQFFDYPLPPVGPDGDVGDGIAVVELAPDFFIQFTGQSDVTTPASNFGHDDLWGGGSQSEVKISSTEIGVFGNSVQDGDVLDYNFYSTNPGANLGPPTSSAPTAFITVAQFNGSEDFIITLKLADPNNLGVIIERTIVVDPADVLTTAPAGFAALGQNQGYIIIEPADYINLPGVPDNYELVGLQLRSSNEGVSSTAGETYNFDGDLGTTQFDTSAHAFDTANNTGTNDNDVFKIFDIGVVRPTTTDQSATIDFDVIIHDADGDTATQHITVNIGDTQSAALLPPDPQSFSIQSTESLLVSDSGSDQQLQRTAANSNTLTMAAAVAATGLAETQAAASPPADDQSSDSLEAQVFTTQVVETLAADDGGDDGSAVSGLPETQEADEAPGNSGGHSQGDEHRSDASLDAASNNQSLEAGSSSHADNDQGPAAGDTAASNAAAPTVGMPSAEALAAAGLDGNAQHGGSVEEIVADALGHGNGQAVVDALLDAFHGGNGGGGAVIANLASPATNAVSAWDMASNAGSSGNYEMLMKVGAEMLHHDMVQPTHNG